jgi:predicted acetyltransferase
VLDDLTALYDRVLPTSVGHLGRSPAWWQRRLYDPAGSRDGAGPLRVVVHRDGEGMPDAYALYSLKPGWNRRGPQGTIEVGEVEATTPAAHAAVWEFPLRHDLVRNLRRHAAPADEPLVHQLTDPHALEIASEDRLWVRLVDVDRALTSRSYARELDVVLEVTDDFCPWNAGRWHLTATTCHRTDAAPDLALSAAELGAAYLGGTTLGVLTAAGRVRELRPGKLEEASAAFAHDRAPHCADAF